MLCDMAMAGRMAHSESIAAVAIGAAVTHFVIGIWSLLRMGTTGFTAQAWGAGDVRALLRQLSSGSIIALTVGLILVLLRPLYITPAADLLQDGSASLSLEAQEYLSYSFLGAPAALLLYVYNGWLIGVQRMKLVMSVSIGSNLANILFSYLLAFPFKMGVGGLALGTALAQYAAIIALALGAWHSHRRILRLFSRKYLWHPPTLVRYFHVGKYLLIRTLTLQAVTLFFIHAGGMIGVTTLAANSLLMQLFTLFSYFMDGIAYAAEALVGEAIGARDRNRLKQVIPTVLRVGLILASIGAVLYAFLPEPFLSLLTDKTNVLERALEVRYWMALVPLVSFAAFLWDGSNGQPYDGYGYAGCWSYVLLGLCCDHSSSRGAWSLDCFPQLPHGAQYPRLAPRRTALPRLSILRIPKHLSHQIQGNPPYSTSPRLKEYRCSPKSPK